VILLTCILVITLPCHYYSDACAIAGVPWVYSAILAFEGQVSLFNYKSSNNLSDINTHSNADSTGPDYRDLLPVPPPPGDVPSCAEGGVLGVLPGLCGCLQATEVLKVLLDRPAQDLLVGRVLVVDAMKMTFQEIGLVRNPERTPIQELIDYQGFCGAPQSTAAVTQPVANDAGRTMDEDNNAESTETRKESFHTVTPQQALDKLTKGWTPYVLDVRLPTEHAIVALPFTDHVQPHRKVHPRDLPSKGDVLVYCKAGVRGKKACNRLIEHGVDPDRLYNLEGGILKWQKDVDPSMPRY
jgi:sulfur-carrier protein adenylyltransferase/sulfurtransferase